MPRVEWSFFMPAQDHKQIKWFMTYVRYRLTPWGLTLFLNVFAGTAIASVGTQIAGYLFPSFILALLLTSLFFSLFFKPTLDVKRILPPAPTAGGSTSYYVTVKNTGNRVLRNLAIFEQALPYGLYADFDHPSFRNAIPILYPGECKTLSLVFKTPRRGAFDLPKLIAGSSYPSGIMRSRTFVGRSEKFTVLPKIIGPGNIPAKIGTKLQPGGLSISLRSGESNDFSSTREYRQGDRLRDIHWASSARSGTLISKEYIDEHFVRVGLFMDTELTRFEKHKCFETRVSLCAGWAETLNHQNFAVDLFTSDPHLTSFQFGRGRDNYHHCLEILSVLEGDSAPNFQDCLSRMKDGLAQLSFLVLFLKDWDESRAAFVKSLTDQNIQLHSIIIRDNPPTLKPSHDNAVIYTTKQLEKLG